MIRDGKAFRSGLLDDREVWLNGERVADVTTHPAIAPAVMSTAHLYDMQHDAAWAGALVFDDPASGEPVGRTYQIPRTAADLRARGEAIALWQESAFGMMGRAPDFLNSMVASLGAKAEVFGRQHADRADAARLLYERSVQNDIFFTHALIDPQLDRGKRRHEQPDPGVPLRIIDRTTDGLIVDGAKMVATAAPYADEVIVWPFPPTFVEGEEDYAVVFSLPIDTPGLKVICRSPFARGGLQQDYPLSSRFDEMDAFLVFQEVLVPWERVLLHQDVGLMNVMYRDTRMRELTAHQTNIRLQVKLELVYALLVRMAEAIGVDKSPAVMASLGEAVTHAETIRNAVMASEYQAQVDPENGVIYPDFTALQVGRMLGPRIYPDVVRKVKRLGAGGLMQMPASVADFDSPIGPLLERYYQGAGVSAREKISLFKFAWDVCGSEFGSRHDLYEMFYAGDPDALLAGMHREYPRREEHLQRFDAFRAGEGP
ncbi:MAG: 4-hydroxyphenylacetate 3-hydroxylase N-terminal domain-containing protein [Pseudomonadota bacterium]|nr:4-hydroxyphenylacetate 3-hydroxylase N-terminal domain-containing protein [Pseudomonadota bacterium]